MGTPGHATRKIYASDTVHVKHMQLVPFVMKLQERERLQEREGLQERETLQEMERLQERERLQEMFTGLLVPI